MVQYFLTRQPLRPSELGRLALVFGCGVVLLSLVLPAGSLLAHRNVGPTGPETGLSLRLTALAAGSYRVAQVATVGVGPAPIDAVYDSRTGYVYCVNENDQGGGGAGSVTVVQNTSVLATLAVGITPVSAALDESSGLVYIANGGSDNLTVINDTSVVASVSLAFPPQMVVYDPADHYIYALDAGGNLLGVVNGTTLQSTLTIGAQAFGAAFDTANGNLYVSNSGSANVSVVNGTRVVATIPVPGYPEIPAYDPIDNYVYVPTGDSNVSVLQGTSAVTALNLGLGPQAGTFSATFDPVDGHVYVTDFSTGHVTALKGLTIEGSAMVGSGAYYATVDPSDGFVYVTVESSNAVAVLNGTNLTQMVQVGRTPWTSVYDSADRQLDVVAYGSNALDLLRWVETYSVTFNESGLPLGSSWGVQLGGIVNMSSGTTVGFQLPNGTFNYTVPVYPGFSSSPASGTLTISGTDVLKEISFTPVPPPQYSLTFVEQGLPTGTSWWVNITGVGSGSTFGTSVNLSAPNGTYHFTANASGTDYSQPNGSVTVSGTARVVQISFVQIRFSLSFVEVGLPIGIAWSVNLSGSATSGSGALEFGNLSPGFYAFTVPAVLNYTPTPSEGMATISNASVVLHIHFAGTSNRTSTQIPSTPAPFPYALVGAGIAVVAVAASLAVIWRLRRRP